MTRPKVLVVGGGVVGISCAYYLARGGARVVVLERARIAAGASAGNAGTVSPGHPPLNRPGIVRSALRKALDPASPLFVPLRWDPDLWRWLVTFVRHATALQVERCMETLAPLGLESLTRFDELVEGERIVCGYRREGYFDLCATPDGMAESREEAELVARYGYHPERLEGRELQAHEPALTPNLLGGVFYPEAAFLDPLRFMDGLAERCRGLGVEIREGEEVAGLRVEGGRVVGVDTRSGAREEADAVLLATGPFDPTLTRAIGLTLPVQPGKGYHVDLPVGARGAPPLRIACVLRESSVFCTPMGDRVRFAGTMELSGWNGTMRRDRLDQILRAARAAFPALGDGPPRSEWCGLRPMSADGLPVVGRAPGVEGLWIATGHGMLGLTLAPATGARIARGILEQADEQLFGAMTPGRLA